MLTLNFTEQQILEDFRSKGQIALQVYETYHSKAFNILRKKGATEEVAEELVNESWIPFLLKLPEFELKGEGALYAYFQNICNNKFFSHCEKEKRDRSRLEKFTHAFESDEDNQMMPSPLDEEDTLQAWKKNLLHHMMKFVDETLRSKCQQLFRYRYWDNLPLAEIDRLMGTVNAPGTSSSKNELFRCKKKLSSLMAQFV